MVCRYHLGYRVRVNVAGLSPKGRSP